MFETNNSFPSSYINFRVNNADLVRMSGSFVGIGTTTDAGFRLDVNGTARVQGVLTATADAVVNGVSIGRGGGDVVSNTRNGDNALQFNTTGSTNTAVGGNTLRFNTTGSQSTAVGYFALYSNNGSLNTAVGRNAMSSNTTGGNSVGVGGNVLTNNTIGSNNVGIGNSAGRYIADGVTPLTIANNSVFLGAGIRANEDNETNQIVIGYNAIGLGSNSVVLGNDLITFTGLKGNVGVGTTTNAGFKLDVSGNTIINGGLTATTISATTYQNLPSDVIIINSTPIQSGFTGGILFQSSASTVTQNSNLFWDNANGRLGIGTITPTVPLEVTGNIRSTTMTAVTSLSTGTVNANVVATNGGNMSFLGSDIISIYTKHSNPKRRNIYRCGIPFRCYWYGKNKWCNPNLEFLKCYR
jgi:hypothetical protein